MTSNTPLVTIHIGECRLLVPFLVELVGVLIGLTVLLAEIAEFTGVSMDSGVVGAVCVEAGGTILVTLGTAVGGVVGPGVDAGRGTLVDVARVRLGFCPGNVRLGSGIPA